MPRKIRTFQRGPTYYIDESTIYKIPDGASFFVPLLAGMMDKCTHAYYLYLHLSRHRNTKDIAEKAYHDYLEKRIGIKAWQRNFFFRLNRIWDTIRN